MLCVPIMRQASLQVAVSVEECFSSRGLFISEEEVYKTIYKIVPATRGIFLSINAQNRDSLKCFALTVSGCLRNPKKKFHSKTQCAFNLLGEYFQSTFLWPRWVISHHSMYVTKTVSWLWALRAHVSSLVAAVATNISVFNLCVRVLPDGA